jgi:hypothetical protein
MQETKKEYDAIIIGGGMFGLYAAHLLSEKGASVAILEKEKAIMERASKINQSRVHRGYHYPRSFETAKKASDHYFRFCNDFRFAMIRPFKQFYAISRENSKISVSEYIHFCKKLNIPLKEVDTSLFFKKDKIAATFEVEEACFDYIKIKEHFKKKFTNNNLVDIYYQSVPISWKISNSKYILDLNNTSTKLIAPIVINATYSSVNNINKMFGFNGYDIKYELCELKLCKMKNGFSGIGLTVMDGPFFSLMPFSDGKIYSLSSVRFTPVDTSYKKPQNIEKYINKKLNDKKGETLATSYLKDDIDFEYQSSIFEVKPIMLTSEEDDSRPTLITVHSTRPFFISILSGKISNIYDLKDELYQIIKDL